MIARAARTGQTSQRVITKGNLMAVVATAVCLAVTSDNAQQMFSFLSVHVLQAFSSCVYSHA